MRNRWGDAGLRSPRGRLAALATHNDPQRDALCAGRRQRQAIAAALQALLAHDATEGDPVASGDAARHNPLAHLHEALAAPSRAVLARLLLAAPTHPAALLLALEGERDPGRLAEAERQPCLPCRPAPG